MIMCFVTQNYNFLDNLIECSQYDSKSESFIDKLGAGAAGDVYLVESTRFNKKEPRDGRNSRTGLRKNHQFPPNKYGGRQIPTSPTSQCDANHRFEWQAVVPTTRPPFFRVNSGGWR